jgi:hypothetical protein
MSDDPKRQLMLSAFRSHLRGEQPQEVELATAPRLDMWEACVGRDGDKGRLVLRGEVRGHPSLPDGERIGTSAVVWLDRQHRWARTVNRLYVLEGRVVDEGFEA